MKTYKKIALGTMLIAPIALIVSCENSVYDNQLETFNKISKNLEPHWIEGKDKEFVDLNKASVYQFKQGFKSPWSPYPYEEKQDYTYFQFGNDVFENYKFLLEYKAPSFDRLELEKKVYEKYRKVNYYEVSFTGILKGEERVRKPYKFKLLDMYMLDYYKFGFDRNHISGDVYQYSFNIQKTQNDLITIYEIRQDDYYKKIEFKEKNG